MGRESEAQLEEQDRGWVKPSGHVCADCVDDEYLCDIIRQNSVEQEECTYCGNTDAAPVATLMEAIAKTVLYYYQDPTVTGVPSCDGAFIIEPVTTSEVLYSIGLECNSQMLEDIERAFIPDVWVDAADGHWASSHLNIELGALWSNFAHGVKHKVRYFFNSMRDNLEDRFDGWRYRPPQAILSIIGEMVERFELYSTVTKDTQLFRVREREGDASWEPDAKQMGAPPSELARAGRMNPAGISYLYLAFEKETGLAEVLNGPPCSAAVASFVVVRDLRVLDLSVLPKLPSIFDDTRREDNEGLLFLREFVREISDPVRKDGREHIGYVPSQVISEYFAQVFTDGGDHPLNGIIYPSAVKPGGKNLVLFPEGDRLELGFDQVAFHTAEVVESENWSDLFNQLGSGA